MDQWRIRSWRFLRIFTLAFLLYLATLGGSNHNPSSIYVKIRRKAWTFLRAVLIPIIIFLKTGNKGRLTHFKLFWDIPSKLYCYSNHNNHQYFYKCHFKRMIKRKEMIPMAFWRYFFLPLVVSVVGSRVQENSLNP